MPDLLGQRGRLRDMRARRVAGPALAETAEAQQGSCRVSSSSPGGWAPAAARGRGGARRPRIVLRRRRVPLSMLIVAASYSAPVRCSIGSRMSRASALAPVQAVNWTRQRRYSGLAGWMSTARRAAVRASVGCPAIHSARARVRQAGAKFGSIARAASVRGSAAVGFFCSTASSACLRQGHRMVPVEPQCLVEQGGSGGCAAGRQRHRGLLDQRSASGCGINMEKQPGCAAGRGGFQLLACSCSRMWRARASTLFSISATVESATVASTHWPFCSTWR